MSKDVFISYAREDEDKALTLRSLLRNEGINVWWDDKLLASDRFEKTIDEKLASSAAILVLWSKNSVTSEWVNYEAAIGKGRNTLVPASIDDCTVPDLFKGINTTDLSNFRGHDDDRNFLKIVRKIELNLKNSSTNWIRLIGLLTVISLMGIFAWYLYKPTIETKFQHLKTSETNSLRVDLVERNATITRLEEEMTSLKTRLNSSQEREDGIKILEEKLEVVTTERDNLNVELDQMAKRDVAREAALNTANDNDLVEKDATVTKLNKEVNQLEKEIDQIAEISFIQINSAIAERDAAIDQRDEAREAALNTANDNSWAVARRELLGSVFAGFAEVVVTDDNKVSVELVGTGLFRSSGTVLTENGKNVILRLGAVLAEIKDAHINVVGHTDNLPVGTGGRFASNAELSLARASSVLRYLNRNVGISADNLSASGWGGKYPIASNDTAEGRTANRRVEILLSHK